MSAHQLHQGEPDATPFHTLLRQHLTQDGWYGQYRKLAQRICVDRSTVSKIVSGNLPSQPVAEHLDEALHAGGALQAAAERQRGHTTTTPPQSSAPVPQQLPATPLSLVGRSAERSTVALATQTATPLALDGPGGVGKSALAVDLARQHTQEYPDGILYAALQGTRGTTPTDPSAVADDWLRALGYSPEALPIGQHARSQELRRALARRRMILVLDDAASESQLTPLLPDTSSCLVLITSRHWLPGVDSMRVHLQPLAEDEAVALLRQRLSPQHRQAATDTWLHRLAGACSHWPLALKVAAQRVNGVPVEAMDQLVTDLASSPQRRLALPASSGQSMSSVLGWSYDPLPAPLQRAYRLLALHPGRELPLGAAAALLDTDPTTAEQHCEQLVQLGLLEVAGVGRYAQHDLLRDDAAARAGHEDPHEQRQAALRRELDWYLASADRANRALGPFRAGRPDIALTTDVTPEMFEGHDAHDRALAWCDAEIATFTPLITTALQSGFRDAWKLAIVLYDYLNVRQPRPSWHASHQVALRAAEADGDQDGIASCHQHLGEVYRRGRAYQRAEQHYRAGLAVRRTMEQQQGIAWALTGLGCVYRDAGQPQHARPVFDELRTVAEQLGDPYTLAVALLVGAEVRRQLGDTGSELAEALQRAVGLYRELEAHHGLGLTLTELALLSEARGAHETALDYAAGALQAHSDAGSDWAVAAVLQHRARLLSTQGRSHEAQQAVTAALERAPSDDPHAHDLKQHLTDTRVPDGQRRQEDSDPCYQHFSH